MNYIIYQILRLGYSLVFNTDTIIIKVGYTYTIHLYTHVMVHRTSLKITENYVSERLMLKSVETILYTVLCFLALPPQPPTLTFHHHI